jgi:hypothetical protein
MEDRQEVTGALWTQNNPAQLYDLEGQEGRGLPGTQFQAS